MNPLTNMKNVIKLSEQELQNSNKSSWHDQYKDSAWVFVGGLPFDLTEGDIICIFSQYGEIVNINLIRDKDTGKSKGFCFLCYEDQRSTILAVDNLNGFKILKRTIRVDHVAKYKVPKDGKKTDEETKKLYSEGCAPKAEPIAPKIETTLKQDVRETIADQIEGGLKLPRRLPIYTNIKDEKISDAEEPTPKKKKKEKKKKNKKKKSKRSEDSDSSYSDEEYHVKTKKKKEKERDRSNDSSNKGSYGSGGKYDRDGSSKDYKRSPKRSGRSRSREKDRDEKPKYYNRDPSPNIPKRYRR